MSSGRARGRARGRVEGAGDAAPVMPLEMVQQVVEGSVVSSDSTHSSSGVTKSSGNADQAAGRAALRGAVSSGVPRDVEQGLGAMGLRERRDPLERFQVFHTKPDILGSKKGSMGKPLALTANFFKVETKPNFTINQYHVTFKPEVDHPAVRKGLLKDQKAIVGEGHIFDGMVMWTSKLYATDPLVINTQKRDGEHVTIELKLTNQLPPTSPECMRIMDCLLRECFRFIGMEQVGRNFFFPKLAQKLQQHKLEIWPGFVACIQQFETQLLMCIDVSSKVLRTDTVLDAMADFQSQGGNFQQTAMKELVGQVVLTTYINKTHRISDIAFDKNPLSTFERKGEQISIADYYFQEHKVKIRDLKQPLLIIRNPKKMARTQGDTDYWIVPELCRMTGMTDSQRANFSVMKDVATITRVDPLGRMRKYNEFCQELRTNPECKAALANWSVTFAEKEIQFQGRQIPAESLTTGAGAFTVNSQADWSRETRDKPFIEPKELTKWGIICVKRDEIAAKEFAQTCQRVAGAFRMNIGQPKIIGIANDSAQAYVQALETVPKDAHLICCLLTNKRKERYDAIKKYTCCTSPIPSQCVVGQTLKKNMMSVCTKIVMQLNCKLGGPLWEIRVPVSGMMVVGYDTYHDTAKKGRSVGGFVASMNQNCSKWFSRATMQVSRQELNDHLKSCMRDALTEYHKKNGNLPARVVMMRDGVSDSQLPAVREHEVQQFQGCFKAMGTDYDPGFTFIVVTKRITQRFFLPAQGGYKNPDPGTVIDDCVTRHESYDFYIISQLVRQGTVSPVRYNVVYDNKGQWKPDHLQALCYKLCHMYYNWPGTVRVPAPCQYAHKLAFLVGESLHQLPSPGLENNLYYL